VGLAQPTTDVYIHTHTHTHTTSYRPGAGETISRPADGSSTRGGSTSVRGRVRSPHMARLQAASVIQPRAAAPWDRRTDRKTDRGFG